MYTKAIAFLVGGAERDRTADLVNAIHALSQLSYGPDRWDRQKGRRDGSAVPPPNKRPD